MNLFQVGCSEQLNKTHNFKKIIFVTSSLWNSVLPVQNSDVKGRTAQSRKFDTDDDDDNDNDNDNDDD